MASSASFWLRHWIGQKD